MTPSFFFPQLTVAFLLDGITVNTIRTVALGALGAAGAVAAGAPPSRSSASAPTAAASDAVSSTAPPAHARPGLIAGGFGNRLRVPILVFASRGRRGAAATARLRVR